MRSAALNDPNNLHKWDEYFQVLEECWDSQDTSEDAKPALKSVVSAAYGTLLARFPYLTQYWKRYLIVLYKMGGISDSIKALKEAVSSFPHSVPLWVDYLSALMADLEQEKEEAAKQEKIDVARAQFERAADLVGLNFNSDPFWNKYIEFETKYAVENPSPQLLKVLVRLAKIPLYQYAQYSQQFSETIKSFSFTEVVTDKAEVDLLLAQYGKTDVLDLSSVEQHQLLDAYAYGVFTETQRRVTEKWPFESALTLQEFSIADLDAIHAQTKEWVKYLDHEIELLKANPENKAQYHLVVSLFERALVPNCFESLVWEKYVSFLQEYSKFLETKKAYLKAIYTFMPLDQPQIRESYVAFLMAHEKFDDANEFLLDTIRLYSGGSGSRAYIKTAYLQEVTELMKLWKTHVSSKTLLPILENLVSGYFDRIDRYKKETKEEQTEEKEKYEFKSSYSTALSKFLNNHGICVVTVAYLRLLAELPDSTIKIRKFYNKHYQERPFSLSVQFWKFFVEFEEKNLINLRSILNHIKTATALPKIAVDAFLDIYYDITCSNLATCMALPTRENLLDILVTRDAEKSEDLFINESARARLAHNNYLLRDKGHHSREDQLMAMRLKHLDHPGVFVDAVPEITNSIMDREWVSLLDKNIEALPLPIFKNVDKANAPINYDE